MLSRLFKEENYTLENRHNSRSKLYVYNMAILRVHAIKSSAYNRAVMCGGDKVAYDTRELFARLIQCEAGGEGYNGMQAVASVIMNRATVPNGEFSRISNGGDVRAIITQRNQFTCLKTTVGGKNNPQNVYNMTPQEVHYEIADWALAGNTASFVGDSLFFFNPYSKSCPDYFPTKVGKFFNRVGDHCFYSPTAQYANT